MTAPIALSETLLNVLGVVAPQARAAVTLARGGTVLDVVRELFPTPGAFNAVRGELETLTVARLGPIGKVVMDLVDENVKLRFQLRDLESLVAYQRPLKGRSPAVWSFRVTRFELVDVDFQPGTSPDRVEKQVLRIYVPLEDKPDGAPYWDVSRKNLIARLLPLLPRLQQTGQRLTVEHVGTGPGSYDTVRIEPTSP